LPAISWTGEGHRAAKKLLDTLNDAALFGVAALVDEQAGAAVRSLLYLWTGWTADCAMFSQAAGEPERLYVSALCERHNQQFDKAKVLFKQLADHPIYPDLADYALGVTGHAADPGVQRMHEMLNFDRRWEPYLFCDAIAQACCGKLKAGGETVLRQMQCREFELLLVHCCERATGCKLSARTRGIDTSDSARRTAERERRIREDRKRRDAQRQRDAFTARLARPEPSAPAAGSQPVAPKVPAAAAGVITILCPKCGKPLVLPASSRGKVTNCLHCSVSFKVPSPQAAGAR